MFDRTPRSTRRAAAVCPPLAALALAACIAIAPSAHAEAPPSDGPLQARYAGKLVLDVDATDTQQRIVRVHEVLPVKPGKLRLYYPRWLPGTHSPTGPLAQLAGLQITAGGQPVAWTRDTLDVYAVHVDVPKGAAQLELDFQFLSPNESSAGRVVATSEIVGLQWNTVVLYPAGYRADGITVQPSVRLPAGWQVGTALRASTAPTVDGAQQRIDFQATSLDQLVDSPLFAGRNFKRIDLDPDAAAQGRPSVQLNLVADAPQQLEMKPEQLAAHRALVTQALRLYGGQHYAHYDFLLALSNEFSGIGLEHHQSSENGVSNDYFTDWDKNAASRSLLPHEYTHSWNGKFRRPADLTTPHFNVPMQDSLLWVYEGQTQYWGKVLSARSGLLTAEEARADLAEVAAYLDVRAARTWRNLQDTTNDPVIAYRSPKEWPSWQRGSDYYDEAVLIWLDADTKLRELSGGKRSLDDFAQAFFGVDNNQLGPKTYTFDEVVRTLNHVQPFDWAPFLRERLDGHGPGAPLDGLQRAGWKLVYSDEQSGFSKAAEGKRRRAGFTYSLGIAIGRDDKIAEVLWDSPAFKAGIAPQSTLLAVNGRAYKSEVLRAAIVAAKTGKEPIELLVKSGEMFRTVQVDYHGGLRFPKLERIDGSEDRLAMILAPRP